MTILNSNYQLTTGEYGLAVITRTGRCTGDASQVSDIEDDCTKKYALVSIPNAAGAVLKALDGSNPSTVSITPDTIGNTYTCVKIDGRVNPLAPTQTGGDHNGQPILNYMMKYQEVGGLSA